MSTQKIMLLGEIGVGKSSLVRRLVLDRFDFDYKPTLGVDIYRYEVPAGNERDDPTTLLIWDTDGNFGESIFRHVYMRQAQAALIIADATRPSTLNTMASLATGFKDAFPGRHHAFIINKLDLIQPGEDLDLPTSILKSRINITNTSAKTGQNVRTAFHDAAKTLNRRSN